MKKILVTGSNGLLGQKITEKFLHDGGFELVATSRGANRFPVKEGYTYLELDITDEMELKQVIASVKPDVVINTAAMANPDQCEADHPACDLINVEAVQDLAVCCEALNIHLIHLSTDFVFDGATGPYAETAETNPLSYYGRSKVAAEKMLEASSCKWTVIRTILVYGVVSNLSRSNVVLWVKSSLEQGKPIRVVSDQWRMPTLAEDLADACILAALKGAAGMFHISGDRLMSVFEIAQEVADFFGLDGSRISPVESASLNEVARRPARTGFILDRACRELGYKPHSFREGLEVVKRQLDALAGETGLS